MVQVHHDLDTSGEISVVNTDEIVEIATSTQHNKVQQTNTADAQKLLCATVGESLPKKIIILKS